MRTTAAILALTTAAALAAPAAAINYGTAQGTVLAGGERFELTHAYAVHRGGVFENGGGGDKTLTIVRLVDGEVAADAIADDKKFAKAIADGKLHAIEVQLKDETGEIASQRLYHAGKTFDAPGGEEGTWLRGEYNNKVIWGGLATDGVQPFGNEGFWRYEVFFAAQFQAPPAAALSENTASGTFKLGGKSAKLVAARAWVEPEEGSATTYTVVLLSSAPIELATARDDAKLLAALKKQKLQAFKIKINDQEGSLVRQSWITSAGAEDMEPQEGLRWASWEFTTDAIVGFVTSDGERQAGKSKWAVESHFNAAIAPAPAAE
jgi:hypothetical protein